MPLTKPYSTQSSALTKSASEQYAWMSNYPVPSQLGVEWMPSLNIPCAVRGPGGGGPWFIAISPTNYLGGAPFPWEIRFK